MNRRSISVHPGPFSRNDESGNFVCRHELVTGKELVSQADSDPRVDADTGSRFKERSANPIKDHRRREVGEGPFRVLPSICNLERHENLPFQKGTRLA